MNAERRKVLIGRAKEFILFFLLSVVQSYLMCVRCNTLQSYALINLFTFLMWIMLWKGNERLGEWITTRVSWIEFPLKRLFIGIVSTIAYTVLSMLALMTAFEVLFNLNFGRGYMYTIYGSIVITILISLFLHGRAFLLHWKQATLDKEKFEKESIAARYESLKNQVNPHFLFNSLNALSNLVYEDPDKAVRFIKQLSDVYRYVLDTRDQEVVSAEQELQFLDSYLYLQKIRFGDKLIIHNQLTDKSFFITPLALQLLLENAIKHNIIAEEEPLTIKLYQEDGYVCVENTLQRKRTSTEPSIGVGLENIRKRYELLSDRKVIVEEKADSFLVKIPKLKDVTS